METYLVHPDKSQEKALKAFLKALAVPFEKQKDSPLPKHVVAGIKRGQDQLENGLGKSTEDVLKKYSSQHLIPLFIL